MYRARPLAPHMQEISFSSCLTSCLRVGQARTSLNFWIGLLISMLSLRRAKSLIRSLFEVTFDLKMFVSDIQLNLESVYYVTFRLMLNQAPMVPPSALPPLPTSPHDLLVAFSASACPSTTTNESSQLVGGSLSSHHDFPPPPTSSHDLLVTPSASTSTSHHC